MEFEYLIKFHKNTCIYSEFFDTIQIVKLLELYKLSEVENKRDGKLTPSVGTSREKDIISYMKYINHDSVIYKIKDNLEEDCHIMGRRLSIKHSSSKIISPGGIKICWTSNAEEQTKFEKKYVFTCDLLIIWVRFDNNKFECCIEIVMISKEELVKQQTFSLIRNESVMKKLKGNSRGVEFDRGFFKKCIKNCDLHYKIQFKNCSFEDVDPIINRVRFLEMLPQ